MYSITTAMQNIISNNASVSTILPPFQYPLLSQVAVCLWRIEAARCWRAWVWCVGWDNCEDRLEVLSIPPKHSNSRTGRPGKEHLSHGWRMCSGCVLFATTSPGCPTASYPPKPFCPARSLCPTYHHHHPHPQPQTH